jgi:phage shock protein E
MFNWITRLFGSNGYNQTIQDYLDKQAVLLDVRTPQEFASGHIEEAKNIPLDVLATRASRELNPSEPLIVYCASGMRSRAAVSALKSRGFSQVINGGGVHKLASTLRSWHEK